MVDDMGFFVVMTWRCLLFRLFLQQTAVNDKGGLRVCSYYYYYYYIFSFFGGFFLLAEIGKTPGVW